MTTRRLGPSLGAAGAVVRVDGGGRRIGEWIAVGVLVALAAALWLSPAVSG